jgi:hypothetical protein
VTSTVLNAQPGAVGFADLEAAVPLLVWLHRDALIKRLDAEIDAEADDGAALTHNDREKRSTEVMQDLLATERDEAALVWSAMSQNLPVEHRNDCAPQAILQVRLVTAPRATNGSGTTPGYSWDLRR